MHLEQLFPSLKKFDTFPNEQGARFSIFYDATQQCWYRIAKDEIQVRDYLMLSYFLKECTIQNDPWKQLLLHGIIPATPPSSSIRILQYYAKNNAQNFSQAAQLYFDLDAYCIEMSPTSFWLILFNDYDKQEIESFTSILENDYFIRGQLFIGQPLTISKDIPALFLTERLIFEQLQKYSFNTIHSVSRSLQILLPLFLPENIKYYLQQTTEHAFNEEMIETISMLYLKGGNISSTAKALHVHRNTLQYRLQRFLQETSLDVKNSEDLLFSYFATQQFKLTKN